MPANYPDRNNYDRAPGTTIEIVHLNISYNNLSYIMYIYIYTDMPLSLVDRRGGLCRRLSLASSRGLTESTTLTSPSSLHFNVRHQLDTLACTIASLCTARVLLIVGHDIYVMNHAQLVFRRPFSALVDVSINHLQERIKQNEKNSPCQHRQSTPRGKHVEKSAVAVSPLDNELSANNGSVRQ